MTRNARARENTNTMHMTYKRILIAAVAALFCACSTSSPEPNRSTPRAHGFGNFDVAGTLGHKTTLRTNDSDGASTLVVDVNSAPLAATVASTPYWTGQSSAATLTGSAVNKSGYRAACFSFTLANTSTPAGTLEVDVSPDGATNWTPFYLDANKPSYLIGSTWTAFSGGQLISISSPAATVTINVCVESRMPFVRLVYTRTSGGAASTINASYTLGAA